MPEILQTSITYLYQEDGYTNGIIELGEKILLQEPRYDVTVLLTVPETYTNNNIIGVSAELYDGDKLIGKGYKILKKYENQAKMVYKFITDIGIIFGLYDSIQSVDIKLSVVLDPEMNFIKFKILPKEVQIEKVDVSFKTRLTGFKYFLHEHFYKSCFIGIFMIFFIQLIMTCLLYAKI